MSDSSRVTKFSSARGRPNGYIRRSPALRADIAARRRSLCEWLARFL